MNTDKLTKDRGAAYGHPLHHFRTTRGMWRAWKRRRKEALRDIGIPAKMAAKDDCEQAMQHSVYMILDKLARAANSPTDLDHWDHIAGYAKCAHVCLKDQAR